jgi:hypothetical protein
LRAFRSVVKGVHFHLVRCVWEASIKHTGLIPFVNPTEGVIYFMAKIVRLKSRHPSTGAEQFRISFTGNKLMAFPKEPSTTTSITLTSSITVILEPKIL